MKNFYSTSDINLVAFLIAKGCFVESTQLNGRFVEFYFEKETEREAINWQFKPNSEMKIVQHFIAEKEKILTFLKNKQNKGELDERFEK